MNKSFFDGVRQPIFAFGIWCFTWIVVFYDTLLSAMSVWANSNTYNHCFFVLPIAAYFAYENKAAILRAKPKPAFIMLVPFSLLVALWCLGYAADVLLFMHAALFGLLSCSVVMFFGFGIAKIIWFPLCFVVFAIPIGEELVPYFQVITADFTVYFLRLSGVAVYRDGLFITIPEGRFEVAEACSGVRFFVACVVMGAVISYVSYLSFWKRLFFFLIAMAMPILANGLRAYGTIMVGHIVGIEHATGVDHLIYGWGFFALIVMLLVAVSRIGADHVVKKTSSIVEQVRIHQDWQGTNWFAVLVVSLLPLILIVALRFNVESGHGDVSLNVRSDLTNADSKTHLSTWKPVFVQPKFEYLEKGSDDVSFYLAGFSHETSESELVSERNRFFDITNWRYINDSNTSFIPAGSIDVIDATLLNIGASNGNKRLVMYWYHLPSFSSSNRVVVKLMQAINVITGVGDSGVVVAISIPYSDDTGAAKKQLAKYAVKNTEKLHAMVLFNH